MPSFPSEQFMESQIQNLTSQSQARKSASNNVSQLGHLCLRYLVYRRTRGDEAVPPSANLQAIFNEGNVQEREAIKIINKNGYNFERSQELIEYPEYEIRGYIDGVTVMQNGRKSTEKWASEIKSIDSNLYERLRSVDDMIGHKWYNKWYVQIQLAIYHVSGDDPEACGILWVKNKGCEIVKPINVPIDIKCILKTFRKAQLVNMHIKNDTIPERIDWCVGICNNCEFNHICMPQEAFLSIDKIDDPVFIDKLRRRESLESASKEFQEIDKEIKEALRNKENLLAPPFKISGKKFGESGWKTTIERMMSDDEAEALKIVTGVEDNVEQIPVPTPEETMDEATQSFVESIKRCNSMFELQAIKLGFKTEAKSFSEETKKVLQDYFKAQVQKIRKVNGE